MWKFSSSIRRAKTLIAAGMITTASSFFFVTNEAGAADACPTDNPTITVNIPNLSGCGATQARALGAALIAASGVVCSECPDGEKCQTLIGFDGVLIGAQWYTIEIEILGIKVTLHCFTNGTATGKLDVDCDTCE
ncbi:MAG: hypothetical protein H6831_02670 [Planctomycetes bacterium]|nr:hypothetical protein [Planctomycetota bacterium]